MKLGPIRNLKDICKKKNVHHILDYFEPRFTTRNPNQTVHSCLVPKECCARSEPGRITPMKDFNTDDDNIPVTSPKVQAPDAIIDQDDLWVMMEDDTQEMVEGMAATCPTVSGVAREAW